MWAPTADKRVLESGPQVVTKFQDLEGGADEVNGLNKRYRLFTNNCNRAAYHILKTAGVRTKRPPGLYFGWGKRLTAGDDNQPAQQNQPGQGDMPQAPQGGMPQLPGLPGEQSDDETDFENLPDIEGLQWIGQ